MKIFKKTRTMLIVAATAAGMMGSPVLAADYTMIMAHGLSDASHPLYKTFEKIKADIEERSGGRIDVEIQSGGALGGDREVMESLLLGDIQFAPLGTSGAIQFIPEFAVFDIPYTLPNDKDALRRVTNDSPLSEEIRRVTDAKGLRFAGIFDGGFRNLTTARTEVRSPDDIAAAGLRIRVQENPVHIAIWKALGAAPTPISFPELYGALQQGVVDGQENPYGHILSQRFYEVQGYLMNTQHIFLANVNLLNKEWYESLPADLQQVIDEVFADASDYQWQLQAEAEATQRAELETYLKVIDLTPEELAVFRDKTADIITMVQERAGDTVVDALLESTGNQ